MAQPCLHHNGTPKQCFADEASALEAVAVIGPGVKVYPCVTHGWHIGGVLTRALRTGLFHNRKPKVKRKKHHT